MNFKVVVQGYAEEQAYTEEHVEEVTSFDFNTLDSCFDFIKFHRAHTSNVDCLVYGYEIIDVEGCNEWSENTDFRLVNKGE